MNLAKPFTSTFNFVPSLCAFCSVNIFYCNLHLTNHFSTIELINYKNQVFIRDLLQFYFYFTTLQWLRVCKNCFHRHETNSPTLCQVKLKLSLILEYWGFLLLRLRFILFLLAKKRCEIFSHFCHVIVHF